MNRTILYVDDDEDDRYMLAEAIKEVDPSINIVLAENGLRAVEYLNEKKDSPLPCLIVLDLNMPFLNGRETYNKIRNELKLETLPVIIFTSSHNPNDKILFTNLGVEFVTKPDDFRHLNKIVKHMVDVCNG
jgi:CheY-like chemotaxis protein